MSVTHASKPVAGARPGRPPSSTLISAAIVLVLGALTMLVIYLPIRHLQAHDRSAPALEMPSMHMYRLNIFWALPLVEAAGFAALIWSYLGLVLGLMETGARAARWNWLPLTASSRIRLHRHISLLVLGLILVHAVMTALDAMGDNFLSALVPFHEGYAGARLAFDVGIFAFYLALLIGPTYYVRRWLGGRRWSVVHRVAAAVYVLAVWHTLLVGDDVAQYSWLRPLIWALQIPLLLLFAVRLGEEARRPQARHEVVIQRGCLALAGVAALAAVGGVVLIATGGYSAIVTPSPF